MPPDDRSSAEAGIISTETACQLLMLSRQRIDQLVAAGHLHRHAPGKFRTVDLVQGYIRFLRDESKRANKSAADSRVRDAQANNIEVRTAERLGILIPVEAFDAMIDEIVGSFRSELSGLPSRVTRDLVVRRIIEREIHGLLERVTDLCTDHSNSMAKGREAYKAIKDHNPVSVGDQQSNVSGIGGDPRPA